MCERKHEMYFDQFEVEDYIHDIVGDEFAKLELNEHYFAVQRKYPIKFKCYQQGDQTEFGLYYDSSKDCADDIWNNIICNGYMNPTEYCCGAGLVYGFYLDYSARFGMDEGIMYQKLLDVAKSIGHDEYSWPLLYYFVADEQEEIEEALMVDKWQLKFDFNNNNTGAEIRVYTHHVDDWARPYAFEEGGYE